MGLGRIARHLGRVGLLIEGATYVVAAGKALTNALRRRRSEQADDRPAEGGDGLAAGDEHQPTNQDRLNRP
jgi:hypothetical protein